ncbi:MAG TPA: IS21 family transposase [Actinomycetes bacterium]|jgi:transposase|nr:IS21 family transposase [Actinomycetes bacterium]
MSTRLRREEIVTIGVLAEKGQNHCKIARALGVTEGTVRYHLKRAASGARDRRRDRPYEAESVAAAIGVWFADRKGQRRPVNVRELWEHLVGECDYRGSYRSVLRYVRSHYPKPKIRTYRRVETPPGAQSQTDWAEYRRVDVGAGAEPLHAFVMVLSHSRMPAVVWSRREDELSWLTCHNGAFRRLDGVAAVNRIDNVKTAVVRGAGAWGTIHPTYRAYARAVGFHIDACSPGAAEAKGKVEAKVRLSRLRADPRRRRFDGLEELQAWTDGQIERWARQASCPATGETVYDSWRRECERLRSLPILPEPFDVVVTRRVGRDCLVAFEGRHYAVPFQYVEQPVEVRGCAGVVQIWADGRVIQHYRRGTKERLLLDPRCYEGEATDRALPPPPLGRMGRKLEELYRMPVEARPLDLYQALAEVAR